MPVRSRESAAAGPPPARLPGRPGPGASRGPPGTCTPSPRTWFRDPVLGRASRGATKFDALKPQL